MTNRTFIMCKPDAVERGLVGEVIARFERKGLTLAAVELRTADRALAEALPLSMLVQPAPLARGT